MEEGKKTNKKLKPMWHWHFNQKSKGNLKSKLWGRQKPNSLVTMFQCLLKKKKQRKKESPTRINVSDDIAQLVWYWVCFLTFTTLSSLRATYLRQNLIIIAVYVASRMLFVKKKIKKKIKKEAKNNIFEVQLITDLKVSFDFWEC